MNVKNVLALPKRRQQAHGGEGRLQFCRPFGHQDFESPQHFVDYVELPPGVSIGTHAHGDDEEIYFIVEGRGEMVQNGERFRVETGDLILNRAGWSHGLLNDGSEPLRVLVWEVGLRSEGEM